MVPVTWTVDYLALIQWRNKKILLYKIYIWLVITKYSLLETSAILHLIYWIYNMSDYFPPPMILPTVFSWEGCESNLHMMFEPHQILSSIVESIEFIAVGKHYSLPPYHQDRRASKQLYVWLWQQLCSEQKPIWKLVYLRMSLGGYPKK